MMQDLTHWAYERNWREPWLTKLSYAKTVASPEYDFQLIASVGSEKVLLSILHFVERGLERV